MIVAVDATCIGSQLGGDETATRAILRGLVAVGSGPVEGPSTGSGRTDRILVLAAAGARLPTEVEAHPAVAVQRVTRRPGPFHFTTTVPRWLAGLVRQGDRPDVVVAMVHAPVWSPAPVALLVPDLSFLHYPGLYPRSTRWRLQTLVRRQVAAAAWVLTVSEFSRRDLVAYYRLPGSRVHTIPLTIDPPGPAAPTVREGLAARGVRRPYLLYLGNLHPRKNVPLAIRAFRAEQAAHPGLADHQFVIAGRRWFGSDAEDLEALGTPPGRVLFLDRVDDAEREVLLRDAEALVYLSAFEGFGLPPLEAMARGTAVLASTTTAIPEVCADAALLVDPRDEAQVRDGMRRILLDDALRSWLVRRGAEQADRFTPVRTGLALRAALAGASEAVRQPVP